MIIELALASIENLRPFFGILTGAVGFALIPYIATQDEIGNGFDKFRHLYPRVFLPIAFVSLILAGFPSAEDLWKVRIGLIKLELANPENIKKGSEEIARIAKKLECKYLGCEDEKQ